MLGQSFAPLGDQDPMQQGNQPGGAVNPVQEAIKVLSLRMPRYPGASAPAPPQLLQGMGSAGMSAPGGGNPLAALIQQMLMPGAPQGGPGQGAGMPSQPPQAGKPRVDFVPPPSLPGGTAGPGPAQPGRGPWSNLPNPLPTGGGRRPTSV